MTRWAVVSDIHGNLPALEAVLADARAVDGWLDLGDLLSGPLWPRETAARLVGLGWPTIAGNHERQLLTLPRERMSPADRFAADAIDEPVRAWLRALPTALAPAPGLACVHGTPASDLQYLLETVEPAGCRAATRPEVEARLATAAGRPAFGPEVSLLLCGHSHQPRDVDVGSLRIVNPGSVGLPAFDDDHPYPHVIETGSPQARYALVEHTAGGWQVELRRVDYDWPAAVRRAEANGRGDWADALATGRVGRRERDVVGAAAG